MSVKVKEVEGGAVLVDAETGAPAPVSLLDNFQPVAADLFRAGQNMLTEAMERVLACFPEGQRPDADYCQLHEEAGVVCLMIDRTDSWGPTDVDAEVLKKLREQRIDVVNVVSGVFHSTKES